MTKLFTEDRRKTKVRGEGDIVLSAVYESVDMGGVCLGVGKTRKEAFDAALAVTYAKIKYLTKLKNQLEVAAGQKRRRCRAKV